MRSHLPQVSHIKPCNLSRGARTYCVPIEVEGQATARQQEEAQDPTPGREGRRG